MAELLLELFSEEIPAGAQAKAVEDFKKLFAEKFTAKGISFQNIECYTTPRRVALVATGLPLMQEAVMEEKRGPRIDAPQGAIDGFLKSTGLSLNQLEKRNTPKGDFYFAVITQPARQVSEVLVEVIQDIISSYTWQKSMHWGSYGNIRWIRPLHSIICLFNGMVIPVSFGHIQASNKTKGHRFLAPKEFEVKDFADYVEKLKSHYVILKQQDRQELIENQAKKLANAVHCVLKQDEALLAEVANLVEWPVALIGSIEIKFMSVPPEVLIVTMRSHQRYFCLHDKKGDLAPYFITVSNIITDDDGAQIMLGNSRVLRARLEDAKFFWDQDRRHSLESRLPALEKVIFHAKLGTVAEKVQRISELAQFLSVWVPRANLLLVERAAQLCKADLATGMVGEFPELQGLMGSYYAKESKEDEQVSLAIKEHYSPIGVSDSCPNAPLSVAVALADKIDTIAGMFAIDEKPTGSRDPYALRRAAIGIIRIILENRLRIPLRLLIEKSLGKYPNSIFKTESAFIKQAVISKVIHKGSEKPKHKYERLVDEILSFFSDRLRVLLKENDIKHDIIDAVFDNGNEDDLTRLVMRANALSSFLKTEDGINLLAAYKRATNIVEAEEKKDNKEYKGNPSEGSLAEEGEKKLYSLFKDMEPNIAKYTKEEEFTKIMQELSQLRSPLDDFFAHTKVNCDDSNLRKNRLLLLSQFRTILNEVANFAKLEG